MDSTTTIDSTPYLFDHGYYPHTPDALFTHYAEHAEHVSRWQHDAAYDSCNAQGYSYDWTIPTMSYNAPFEHAYAHPDQSHHAGYAFVDAYTHQQPIYAPVPVSAYSTLLAHVEHNTPQDIGHPPLEYAVPPASISSTPPLSPSPSPSPCRSHFPLHLMTAPKVEQDDRVAAHGTVPNLDSHADARQSTFPTPSQLLVELSQRTHHTTSTRQRAGQPSAAKPVPKASSSKKIRSSSSSLAVAPTPSKAKQAVVKAAVAEAVKRPENIRKSYFRCVADYVKFKPTDPDSITSHDKKRHTLEALELYVLWLHEQVSLAGNTPLPLRRVDTYSGPTCHSLRAMLVHFQDEAKRLYAEVKAKDPEFTLAEDGPTRSPKTRT